MSMVPWALLASPKSITGSNLVPTFFTLILLSISAQASDVNLSGIGPNHGHNRREVPICIDPTFSDASGGGKVPGVKETDLLLSLNTFSCTSSLSQALTSTSTVLGADFLQLLLPAHITGATSKFLPLIPSPP